MELKDVFYIIESVSFEGEIKTRAEELLLKIIEFESEKIKVYR